MTDISAEMNLPTIEKIGVPSELIGADRPASIEAKRVLHVAPSENSTYNGGDTVRFTLPCQQNTYLTPDVALRFTFNNTAAAANTCNPDYSASALIKRLRIFHNSQLLEDCDNYNRLRQIITDVSQSPVNSSTISSVLEGTPISGSTTDAQGLNIVPAQKFDTIDGTKSRVYQVQLVSGLIGSLATKSLCTHAMTAGPLRIEIELETENNAIISRPATVVGPSGTPAVQAAKPATWTIDNVTLRATYVQVSSQAQALIDRAVGGRYMINTSMYRHAQQNIPSAAQSANILLPFSYSSLKHVVHGLYEQTNNNDQGKYTISGRSRANVDKTWYQIGASRVPSAPLEGTTEIITEACKCFAISSDLLQVSNHLTQINTGVNLSNSIMVTGPSTATNIGNVMTRGYYVFGFDMEAFGAASSTQRIECGINTTSLQMYWNLETSTTFSKNLEAHSWAQYDCLLTCANGQMFSRF